MDLFEQFLNFSMETLHQKKITSLFFLSHRYDNLTDVLVDDSMPKPGQGLEDEDEYDQEDENDRDIHEGKISTRNGSI